MSGAPALTISSCTIPTEGAPSLRFLQGWARCCFPVMAKAKNWATASRAQFLEKRSLESSEEGLCERPEDWSWTSFLHHATGGEGRVEIESEFVCPKFSLPILVILRSAPSAPRDLTTAYTLDGVDKAPPKPQPPGWRVGGRRCCVCYLNLLWTGDERHVTPAFPTPALRKKTRRTGHPMFW